MTKRSDETGAAAALAYFRELRSEDDLPTAEVPRVTIDDAPAPDTAGGSAPGSLGGSGTVADPMDGEMEWATCPECGTAALIDPSQRRAEDFCPNCDFPLFWARASVVAMSSDETGASLRRLPGTVGRAAAASVACPHCGEPNSPIAEFCVRCDLLMVVVAAPEPEPEPELEPVMVPEPEPELEEEDSALWIVILCAALTILILLIGLYLQ